MSEEREQEVVTGAVSGIIEKGPGKWQVLVKPDGSQYEKKLWTKAAPIHERASALIGGRGSFLCNASYWDGPNGQVRSLWIESIQDGTGVPPGGSEPVAATASPQRGNAGATPQTQATPYTERERQTSIERQTALNAAVSYCAAGEFTRGDVVEAAAVFARFLATGHGDSRGHQEAQSSGSGNDVSGGYSDAPAPGDEDIPFRALDRFEVQ